MVMLTGRQQLGLQAQPYSSDETSSVLNLAHLRACSSTLADRELAATRPMQLLHAMTLSLLHMGLGLFAHYLRPGQPAGSTDRVSSDDLMRANTLGRLSSAMRLQPQPALRSRAFKPAAHTPRLAPCASGSRVASMASSPKRPVLLFDVMDTIVYDPFFKEMPQHFGMTFADLLKEKHPTAWVEFECNRIDGAELARIFFQDGRKVDYEALLAMLRTQYRYLDGMETLLHQLSQAGYELHAFSNYPVWWEIIEDKLALSRYLHWTFVSCKGPMEGVRKPAPEAYQRVVQHLGHPTDQLLFIDDRPTNIKAAQEQGVPSLLFTGSTQLEEQLRAMGLQF